MNLFARCGFGFSEWLKNGFFSGKVSGTVMAVTDLIYYLAFSVCFTWSFLRNSTLFTRLMTHDQRHFIDGIYNGMALAAILCGVVALLLQNSVRLAVFEGVLAAAGYASWKEGGGKAYIFILCAMIVGATGRSCRMILSIAMTLGTILMTSCVVASQVGIVEDLVYSGNRHSFGIVYCTDCAAHILFLMLTWLMIRIEQIRIIDYIPLAAGLVLMYFTHAKADILCALVLIAGTVLYHVSVRTGRRKLWKAPAAVFCFSFLAAPLLSVLLVFLVDTGNASLRTRLDSIDRTLIKRLELGRRAFRENEIRLFGTKITEKGFGGKVGGFKGWDNYFFIDNSYIRLIMIGGLILFTLLIAVLTYAQLRCYASGKYGCVYLLWVVSSICIMEHHLAEIFYNVFPLMAFSGSSFFVSRHHPGRKSLMEIEQGNAEEGRREL